MLAYDRLPDALTTPLTSNNCPYGLSTTNRVVAQSWTLEDLAAKKAQATIDFEFAWPVSGKGVILYKGGAT